MLRAPLPMSLRLLAGVLLACALTLCLAGAARPAMAMPDPMRDMRTSGAEDTGNARQPDTTTADSATEAPHCPATAGHCAQPAAVPPATGLHTPALAEAVRIGSAPAAGAPDSGVPPSANPPPPDLHRLGVSRT